MVFMLSHEFVGLFYPVEGQWGCGWLQAEVDPPRLCSSVFTQCSSCSLDFITDFSFSVVNQLPTGL